MNTFYIPEINLKDINKKILYKNSKKSTLSRREFTIYFSI